MFVSADKILEIIKNCSCCIDEDNSEVERFIITPSHCLTVLKNILLGLNKNVEFNMAFPSGRHTACLIVDRKKGKIAYRFGVEIWEHKIDLCIFKLSVNDMVPIYNAECQDSWEVLETINDF